MNLETREAILVLKEDLNDIKDNHLPHLQRDMTDVQSDIKEIRNDIKWVKMIGGFVIIQGIATIVTLLTK